MGILNSSASSNRRAFTLIEMVIAVSMIVILSGIILGYTNVSRKHVELANNETRLLGLLFNAKSLSQSFILESLDDDEEVCAYGIHVEDVSAGTDFAFIFQDRVVIGDGCETSDNVFTAGEALPESINSFYVSDLLEFGPDIDLENAIFIPPDPTVIINGDPTSSTNPSLGTKSAKIVIQSKEDQDVKFTVILNHAGQISVE